MTKPFYTTAAQQDLADILQYIAKDKPDAAVAWVEKIEDKCLAIAENPSLGDLQRHLGEGIRASFVGRFFTGRRIIASRSCESFLAIAISRVFRLR